VQNIVRIRNRNRNRNFSKVGTGTAMNHYFSTTLLEVECKGPQVVVVFGSVVSSLSFAFHRFLLTFSRRGSSSVKFKEKLIKKSNEDSFLIIAYFLNFFVYVLWPISGTCRT
jgi:hypothetical protein